MKNLLITVFAILLMVGSYLLGKNESSESLELGKKRPAPIAQDSTDVSESTVLKTESGEVITEKSLPLPPANMPLHEIYALLQRRADTGDGKAACRLAIELLRCQQTLNMNKYMSADADIVVEEADKSMRPGDKLKMANSIDEQRLTIMEKAKSCGKISTQQLKQASRYLRQAAYASQPDAMVAYVDGRGLEGEGGFALVRSSDLDLWRRDALPIAQRALQSGVPEAVYLLSNAYSDENSLFSGLIVNDAVHAETMRLLRLRVEGTALPVETRLNASDYQRALSESDAMFRNYFNGRVQPKVSFMKRLTSYASTQKDEVAPCE
jgi:TPR repeat protein